MAVMLKPFLFVCIATTSLFAALPVMADDSRELEIHEQLLSDSLKIVADEFGLDIAFFPETTDGLESTALAGNYTSDEAFDALLDDTSLEYEKLDNGTVVVRAKDQRGVSDSKNSTPQPILMAQNQTSPTQTTNSRTDDDDEPADQDAVTDEIVVTGTHIRGIAPESSPVRVFDREHIQATGAATAQDFMKTVTSNFSGGANVDIPNGLPNDNSARENGIILGGFGSSVNLRGLGSGSTLVLLNGQRLAPSSGIADFVDISMIPASAIERVEVLTDGASSIYGGDAVAGVVNFILRDDVDGFEASVRYGSVTEGDLDEYKGNVAGGKNWYSGSALLVYEFYKRDSLSAGDRSFSQDAVLPHELLPAEERHSVLGAASQELAPNLKIDGSVLFSRRDSVLNSTTFLNGRVIRSAPESDSLTTSAGAAWQYSDNWFLDVSGTHSSSDTRTSTTGDLVETYDIESELSSFDLKTSGVLFDSPGGAVSLAVGAHYRDESFHNFNVAGDSIRSEAERQVYSFYGEVQIPLVGSDNAISGIERLDVNLSARFDDFSDFGNTTNPKVGVLWAPSEQLRLRGTFGTSFKPPPLGRIGAEDLQVSAFSTAFVNSVLGAVAPDPSIADVVMLTVNGTAPNLEEETSEAITIGFDFDEQWNRHQIAFSATWFDIEFEGRLGRPPVPGNVTSFLAHNIAFIDPDAFPDGTIIFSPSQDQVEAAISLDANGVLTIAPSGIDPFDAEIINNALLTRNLATTRTNGIDFDSTYTFELENAAQFLIGVDATYLFEFSQQSATTTPAVDTVSTLYNPVDLKLRGRLGYSSLGGLATNLFINYVDGYAVDSTNSAVPIDPWTTVDLNVTFDTGNQADNRILSNMLFRLSAINLFDEDPPSTPSQAAFDLSGYDPTNASPLGRFIAFELMKQF